MEKKTDFLTWVERHKIVTAVIAFFVMAAIILSCVLAEYITVPREFKIDRVSEGIVPTDEDLEQAVKYERVVIMGIDGAGGTVRNYNMPCFERIFGEGSVNTKGIAQYPTYSAPNWAAMLLGVTAQKHQISNVKATVFPNRNSKYESVFATVSKRQPGSTFYSAVNWTAVNKGIIEDGINGLTKVDLRKEVKGNDFEIDRQVALYAAKRVKDGYKDKITYLHFNSVDDQGHTYGKASPQYRYAMEETDKCLGIVYDAYEEMGLIESTLFICVSDHGHTDKGGHGEESPSEKETLLAVADGVGNVIKGTPGKYVTHDLASIILFALGEKQPSHYDGGVPQKLFHSLDNYR